MPKTPFAYLISLAMLVDISRVWFVLDYGVALWPIWLLPVLVSIVYGNWRSTVGTSLFAIVACGLGIWFHHPGEVPARLRDLQQVLSQAATTADLLMHSATTLESGSRTAQTSIDDDCRQVARQLDEGWSEQVAALHQVTDTLRQHAQAIGQIAAGADEVRKLAERSSRASHEITDLIERIQSRIERTVTAMEEAAGTAQRGAKLGPPGN